MSFVNIGRNFNDLISGLSSLRRRAQLTGQPFSSRDFSNIADSYFASAREAAPAQASLGLQQEQLGLARDQMTQQSSQFGQQLAETKRQAEERLAQERANTLTAQEQMDQARKLGLVNTGIQGTGAGLMGAHLVGWEPFRAKAALGVDKMIEGQVFDPAGSAGAVGGTPGTAPGLLQSASPYLAPGAAGLGAGYLSPRVKEIGEVATLGGSFGGKQERDVLGGAAAGATVGTAILPGPGTVVGAGMGALGGLLGGGK
jgi:hypothetical protein